MQIVLLGPPGAGKGTQAKLLSEHFNLPHISTGDLLREAIREKTELGEKVKQFMEKGDLVPDDLVVELVKQRMLKPDTDRGFILDGFPRNVKQAEILDKILRDKNKVLDKVIYLEANDKVIIQRLSGRRICSKCQTNFHLTNMPPKKDGICDVCGAKLYQRPDDSKEAIKNRIKVYIEKTKGLVKYYLEQNKLLKIDANFEAPIVFERLKPLLS
jgi:adenylate kinase